MNRLPPTQQTGALPAELTTWWYKLHTMKGALHTTGVSLPLIISIGSPVRAAFLKQQKRTIFNYLLLASQKFNQIIFIFMYVVNKQSNFMPEKI